MIGIKVVGETAKGRKVPVTAQGNATAIFFIPVMSFNLKFDIFMLYTIPVQKGKRIIRIAKGFCKKDSDRAAMYDTIAALIT